MCPPNINMHRTTISMPERENPTNPTADFQKILAGYYRAEHDRLENARALLRGQLVPRLRDVGVANIEAAYSGYGDSGAIDGLQFRQASGQRVEREAIPAHLKEQLESCFYEFLPAGFEINDGSQGTLTLDVQSGKITIKHQENYTESRDSTREFDV